jgi:AcrR family transcriptional regulator
MDRRAEEAELRRRRLVDAALEGAAECGLDQLTLQAVADRADVALRTVYNHFSSRDELIGAAMAQLIDEFRDLVSGLDSAPGDDAREQMRHFIADYAATYASQSGTLDVMLASIGIPEVDAVVAEIRDLRRARIREIVRRASREKTLALPQKDAVEIAYLATAYNTLTTLVHDAGLSPAAAGDLLVTTVDRALFGV